MKRPKIFIVEDELITVESIRQVLDNCGYIVSGDAANSADALALIERDMPNLILMDIRIKGGIDGIELANIVNSRFGIPIIYLTAFADRKTVERAKMTDSYGYIIKPVGEMELVTNIEIALYKHSVGHKIREGEKRYRSLFELISDPLFIQDSKGCFIDFNSSTETITGYSRHELSVLNFRDLVPDEVAVEGMFETLERNGRVKDEQLEIRRKDASLLQCLVSAFRVPGVARSDSTIHGVMRDVTRQKEAQKILEEERLFSQALIDSIPAFFYAVDHDGKFIRWNRKLEDLSGLSGNRLRDTALLDMINDKNRDLFSRKLEEGFLNGEVTIEASLLFREAGNIRRDFRITGKRVAIGGKEYLIGAGVDIHDKIF